MTRVPGVPRFEIAARDGFLGRPIHAEAWMTDARRLIVDPEARLVADDESRKAQLRERYGIGRTGGSR